uniref:glutathione transferase n=1 Tax=Echinococcus granulosus TaxID=6210 RepID=A0A068WLL3_ECHGR|nr:glutathione S transferase [Echinococcus granulosus]
MGVEYDDKRYKYGPGPTFDRSAWLSEKFSLGLDFPNCEAMDLRMSFVMTCYNPDFEKLKPGFLETLSQKLPNFGAYLGEKDWLTGDKINYPDFNLCELLNQLRKFEPSCLEMYPKLQSYLTRFENLPALREYMASKEFKTRPCNAPIAKWVGGC